MGWGQTISDDDHSDSDVLLEVTLPVLSNADCAVAYEKSGRERCINPGSVCAGIEGDGRGPCAGDSGGPLVYFDESGDGYQIGIVSWGEASCAQPDFPVVFTRVTAYLDWIEGIIGRLQSLTLNLAVKIMEEKPH